MWVISEIAAMATDLAEFLGGAIGFSLLLHIPMLAGMVITAVLTYGLLLIQGRGFRPMEIAIGALVGLIGLSYLAQLIITPVDWSAVLRQGVKPDIAGPGALIVAVGIVGATVMPHALFLHSGLAGERVRPHSEKERTGLLRYARYEVTVALGFAGLVSGDGNRCGHRVPQWALGGRADRHFIPHACSASRRGSGRPLSCRTDGFGRLELSGRNDGRADDRAGLSHFRHSALVASSADDHSQLRIGRDRDRYDPRTDPEPGGAQRRGTRSDAGNSMVHVQPKDYGGACKWCVCCGCSGDCGNLRSVSEHGSASADALVLLCHKIHGIIGASSSFT